VCNLVEILNEKQKALEDKMADLNRHALFLPKGNKMDDQVLSAIEHMLKQKPHCTVLDSLDQCICLPDGEADAFFAIIAFAPGCLLN
jgi:hypothetical protein